MKGVTTDSERVVALLPVVAKYISRSLRRTLLRKHRAQLLSDTEVLRLIEFHLDVCAAAHGMWFATNPDDDTEVGFYEDTLFDRE